MFEGLTPLIRLPDDCDLIMASQSFSFIFRNSSISFLIFSLSYFSSLSCFSSLFITVTAVVLDSFLDHVERGATTEILSNYF
jgi:hypothetical protein